MSAVDELSVLPAQGENLQWAAKSLCAGDLVVFPTETVYGLGADARNDRAVASVFAAKGRPRFNPLIVHVRDLQAAGQYGIFGSAAVKLAQTFWPGPLTLVVARREDSGLSMLVSGGLDSIALRAPGNVAAQQLLAAFDGPIAAPSANISGRLSPTEAEHVEGLRNERIAMILDGGPCERGLESTIVGLFGDIPLLLRPGAISREDIETLLGRRLGSPEKLHAPGQLQNHYAPKSTLRLDVLAPEPGEMFLGFGPKTPTKVPGLNLSPAGDLVEAAANLFAYLHILDETGAGRIAVMPIPAAGLGEAINDRLRRAAAPREGNG